MSRKMKDKIVYGIIGLAALFTVGILLYIIGFIVSNGWKMIDWNFLTRQWDTETRYVQLPVLNEGTDGFNKLGFKIGKTIYQKDTDKVETTCITDIRNKKIKATLMTENRKTYELVPTDRKYTIKKGFYIKKIDGVYVHELPLEEVEQVINAIETDKVTLTVVRPGGGIVDTLTTTLVIIGLTLIIASPIGILSAIYLTEYAKKGVFVRIIRFATESLSGIPSIIYGLFGFIFFVELLKFKTSILSGSLTLTIILLPIIIRQTEESLKTVPQSYREGSFGLGATKLQTIRKIILPSAIPGIIVAVILSIGRIIGESAALLFTAGTTAHLFTGFLNSGATMTVNAYMITREMNNLEGACAFGIIILVVILMLNILSKLISKKLRKQ